MVGTGAVENLTPYSGVGNVKKEDPDLYTQSDLVYMRSILSYMVGLKGLAEHRLAQQLCSPLIHRSQGSLGSTKEYIHLVVRLRDCM